MDPRIGRRWNIDPVPAVWESGYAVNRNNPIQFNDPLGDCPDCKDGKYKIQKGDNFSTLEKKWGMDQGSLQSLNPGLDPKKLQIGSTITTETDLPVNKPFTQTTTTTTTTTVQQEQPRSFPVGEVIGGVALLGTAFYYAVTPTPTISISIPRTTTSSKPAPFNYVTYTKTNATTGEVYVGRTSGYGTPQQIVNARDVNHHMNSLGYGPAVPSTSAPATLPGGYATRALDPSYWAIRGSEQLQIEAYRKLGISGNSYNGISPSNPNLGKYIKEALKKFH
jgi:hypothetical protein